MLKSCKYCGRIHDSKILCKQKKIEEDKRKAKRKNFFDKSTFIAGSSNVARKKQLQMIYSYASATLLYLLYSMRHGTGLQSGDVMFWLLFAVLAHESNKNKLLL